MADELEQIRFTLRLPEDLRDELRELADEARRSMNATIILMLEEGITRKKVTR